VNARSDNDRELAWAEAYAGEAAAHTQAIKNFLAELDRVRAIDGAERRSWTPYEFMFFEFDRGVRCQTSGLVIGRMIEIGAWMLQHGWWGASEVDLDDFMSCDHFDMTPGRRLCRGLIAKAVEATRQRRRDAGLPREAWDPVYAMKVEADEARLANAHRLTPEQEAALVRVEPTYKASRHREASMA
jgi:hypothetical protein